MANLTFRALPERLKSLLQFRFRELLIIIRQDIFDLGNEDPDQGDSTGVQISKDGIYTRISDMYRTGTIKIIL